VAQISGYSGRTNGKVRTRKSNRSDRGLELVRWEEGDRQSSSMRSLGRYSFPLAGLGEDGKIIERRMKKRERQRGCHYRFIRMKRGGAFFSMKVVPNPH